jgi:hypothetical protein
LSTLRKRHSTNSFLVVLGCLVAFQHVYRRGPSDKVIKKATSLHNSTYRQLVMKIFVCTGQLSCGDGPVLRMEHDRETKCGVTRRLAPLLSLIIAVSGKETSHRVHRASLARRDISRRLPLQDKLCGRPQSATTCSAKITDNRLHPFALAPRFSSAATKDEVMFGEMFVMTVGPTTAR